MKSTFDEGREAQFQEMMQQLAQLQSKYKGVRGELLSRVSEELARLKPGTAPSVVQPAVQAAPATPKLTPPMPAIRVASASADKMLPSCRMCGRGMRRNDADGSLVCDKGHTRPPARAVQDEGASATQ